MNTNWNNTAFAGNSIPTVGKHIPQSLEAHPYNSAFVSGSNTEYNNHYETTPPIISLPKLPTSPSRNPVRHSLSFERMICKPNIILSNQHTLQIYLYN